MTFDWLLNGHFQCSLVALQKFHLWGGVSALSSAHPYFLLVSPPKCPSIQWVLWVECGGNGGGRWGALPLRLSQPCDLEHRPPTLHFLTCHLTLPRTFFFFLLLSPSTSVVDAHSAPTPHREPTLPPSHLFLSSPLPLLPSLCQPSPPRPFLSSTSSTFYPLFTSPLLLYPSSYPSLSLSTLLPRVPCCGLAVSW